MKNRKVYMLLFILGFAFVLLGTSYAFFEYIKFGSNHELIAGDIYMNFNDGTDSLSLGSVYPEETEHARSRDDNYITFTIEGSNGSEKDLYYEIDLIHGNEHSGLTRFNDKDLCFDLSEIVNGEETLLKSAVSFNEINNTKIYADSINSETENYTRTYKLRMWLSENVLISDTEPDATYSASTYKNHYASIKVKVVGDFDEDRGIKNVMGSAIFTSSKFEGISSSKISEIHFMKDTKENIETRYDASSYKKDLTNTDYTLGTAELQEMTDYGHVYGWLEEDENKENYYKLYIASTGTVYLSTGYYLFAGLSFSALDFSDASSKYVTNMGGMFRSSNIPIDFSQFDTSNVTDMSYMFREFHGTELDLSGWNTSNVTDMSYMFSYTGNYDTTFTLDLSNWDTSKVKTMEYMFSGIGRSDNITSIELIGIEDWNTDSLEKTDRMFNNFGYGNSYLDITLDLHKWNVTKLKSALEMFAYCCLNGKINLNLNHWNLTSLTSGGGMFYDLGYNADEVILDISYWNVPSCISIFSIAYSSPSKLVINASHVDFSKLTSFKFSLHGFRSSTYVPGTSSTINLDYANVSTITDMSNMFHGLNTYEVSVSCKGWDTSNVTTMNEMFDIGSYARILNLDISSFDTSNVTDMSSMFVSVGNSNNTYLTEGEEVKSDTVYPLTLDLSDWDTSNVTNMSNMFSSALETIYVGNNWNVSNVTNSTNMFISQNGVSLIKGGNGTTFDSNHTDKSYAHVDAAGNPGYLTLKTN